MPDVTSTSISPPGDAASSAKTFPIAPWNFFLGIFLWWLAFSALSITNTNFLQLQNIVGFSFLIIVPGLLTVLIIKLKNLDLWGYTGLIVGFSIFELIFVVLLGNTFLPLIGIVRPLEKPVLLLEVYALVGALMVMAWLRVKKIEVSIKPYVIFDTFRDLCLALVPAVFVLLAIMGAIRLNNGGSNIFTLIMLIGIATYSAILMGYSDGSDPNVSPVAFFFMSLALLFMTSLRGWYVTGHDIQREYEVFEFTKNSGIWSIASFRDAYNACLSLTILPTIFSNLLHLFDPYVYKVFFQIIFAVVPGIIYLIVRRYVSATLAFLSTFYFIAFPLFFVDMPFLNRQEVAFLFFSLMVYVIFSQSLSTTAKRALFLLFGIGMVLSHYSTTYAVIGMLIFLTIARPVARWVGALVRKKSLFPNTAVAEFDPKRKSAKPLITVGMVITLMAASFVWSSLLTNTASSSLYRVITETLSVINANSKTDTQSDQVSYSLFSFLQKSDPNMLLNDYQSLIGAIRDKSPDGTYYDPATYASYPITIVPDASVPLTPIGKAVGSFGIDISSISDAFRQASAKVIQLLMLIGLVAVLFSKRFFKKQLETEYLLLAIGGIVFMAFLVLLPVLSLEYGILRAFQQSLIFLGLFIVIGSLTIASKLKRSVQLFIAGFFGITFFVFSSGIVTQTLGGSDPKLFLNNDGSYYDIYYTHATEVNAAQWLANQFQLNAINGNQSALQTDAYSSFKLSAITNLNASHDIYPGLIQKRSYVFLGPTTINKQETSLLYKGTLLTYTYPTDFLNDNKNLIYNDGGVHIYR